MEHVPRIIGGAVLATGIAAASYPLLFRHRCLTWGTTPEEVARELPGDDLLADPDIIATRAVTVDAPPAPSGRGWFRWAAAAAAPTPTTGSRTCSASACTAPTRSCRSSRMKLGDEFQLGPDRPKMRVEVLDPERVLAFRFEDSTWVWIFGLYPPTGDQAGEPEPDRHPARLARRRGCSVCWSWSRAA